MKRYLPNAVCGACLLAAACASTPPESAERAAPPQRVVQKGYSFTSPTEKGWVTAARGAYQVQLVREGTNPDEMFAVHGNLFQLPAFKSPQDLARIIKDGQAADVDTKRYKLLRHDVNPDSTKQSECVRSYAVSEDKAAVKRTSRTGSMVLEVIALTCAHPRDKKVGINVAYSHRYYPGQGDHRFAAKAMQVLDSVDFTDP